MLNWTEPTKAKESRGVVLPVRISLNTGTHRNLVTCKIRGKVRETKGIDGSFGGDCLMAWFCGLCALVQEANELGGHQGMSMVRE
ncbi:hypothetical protein DPMN_064479 [Dreissena polymorpha]|uniref:Uncharacterized protein n=1 Tax=Dreissena polymorpha TaxID=45954 RepID=A0A9D4HJH7_DREPO|nr:hypothetical protein DPMN_064479 [Dreissena polymorpha]